MPPPRHECLLMCLANVGRMWFFFLGWGEWGGLFPLCGVSGFNKDVPLAKSPLNIFFIIDVQPASSVYGQTKFHQLFPFFIQRRPPPPAPRPLLLYWWSRRLSCSWTTCSTPRRLNTVKAVLSQKHLLRTILFRGNFNFILPFFFFSIFPHWYRIPLGIFYVFPTERAFTVTLAQNALEAKGGLWVQLRRNNTCREMTTVAH